MTATQGSKSLAEVIVSAVEARTSALRVALPGTIVRYDAATQTADVRPMVRVPVPDATDEDLDVMETMPVIPSVPVLHPQGGNYFVHMPVAAGDGCLLVFSDVDPTLWRQTGDVSDPFDRRMHDLSHAVALLGYGPRSAALPTPLSGLVFGHKTGLQVQNTSTELRVGGHGDAAALASVVKAVLDALCNATPGVNDSGAAIQAAVKTIWDTHGSSCASDKLKLGG